MKNPWNFESIEDLLFYCCPECDMKSKHSQDLMNHALQSHAKLMPIKTQKNFIMNLKVVDNDPLNVEVPSIKNKKFKVEEHESTGILKVSDADEVQSDEELPKTKDDTVQSEIVKKVDESKVKPTDVGDKDNGPAKLVSEKSDQEEITESAAFHESVLIKEEVDVDMFDENSINDDDQVSDPLDMFEENSYDDNEQASDLLDKIDTNEDEPYSELVEEDYPIITLLPSTLSKNELKKEVQVLEEKHKVPVKRVQSLTRRAAYVESVMKKQHPIQQHLSKMSLNELRNIHEFAIGEMDENIFTQSERLRGRIAKHYFKKHRRSPLTSFLKDKAVSQDPLNTHIQPKVRSDVTVPKRDPNDPSVEVDPATPKRQLIAELLLHGYKVKNLRNLNRDQCQELLEKYLKGSHPIHKAIAELSEQDIKALLCYCGGFVYGETRIRSKRMDNFFANRIFKTRPQSPLTYLKELQSKYENNGPEGHQKLLKKLKAHAKKQRMALKSKIQHDKEAIVPSTS